MLWALGYKGDPRDVWAANYWFSVSEYLLLRISECLNPIFYNLGSNQMRRCTLKLLYKMFGIKHAPPLMNQVLLLEVSVLLSPTQRFPIWLFLVSPLKFIPQAQLSEVTELDLSEGPSSIIDNGWSLIIYWMLL